MTLPFVSVVVTTYNWPLALERVLWGLLQQDYPRMEVIIADDGSRDDTAAVINSFREKMRCALVHCWQPDDGFRAAMCRNKAVAKAKGDYIIFLDGDCVPPQHFVSRHAKLAQKGWFVAGTRVLLNADFTKYVLEHSVNIEKWQHGRWLLAGLQRKSNRFMPTSYLAFGKCRQLRPDKWQGAKTCNLAIWKEDYIAVNGLDENFVGWGFEDSDLVIRLMRYGIKRKWGKYATEVFHLWHAENSRNEMQKNKARLQETLDGSHIKAQLGIRQYIS